MKEETDNIKFMVEFVLPEEFTPEMINTIPAQRKMVDNYFYKGKLISYTLASDRSKLWSIFICQSEAELINLIHKLPMTKYLEYNYSPVLFHQMLTHFPTFSLN